MLPGKLCHRWQGGDGHGAEAIAMTSSSSMSESSTRCVIDGNMKAIHRRVAAPVVNMEVCHRRVAAPMANKKASRRRAASPVANMRQLRDGGSARWRAKRLALCELS
jgi:hypothetical protein